MKRIDRVSFVDKGDNPGAAVVVWKRARTEKRIEHEGDKWVVYDMGGKVMGEHDSEDAARRHLMAIEANKNEKIGLFQKLAQLLGLSDEDVETPQTGSALVEKPVEKKEEQPTPDAVTKAEVEALQKRVADAEKQANDAEARIQKMELEKRTEAFVTKAAAWKHLPIKAADFGPLLRKIADAVTAEEITELERVLQAADETARVGRIFDEIGHGGDGESSANAKVARLVDEIRKANPKLSDVEARVQVYEQQPALLDEVEAEDKQRHTARR